MNLFTYIFWWFRENRQASCCAGKLHKSAISTVSQQHCYFKLNVYWHNKHKLIMKFVFFPWFLSAGLKLFWKTCCSNPTKQKTKNQAGVHGPFIRLPSESQFLISSGYVRGHESEFPRRIALLPSSLFSINPKLSLQCGIRRLLCIHNSVGGHHIWYQRTSSNRDRGYHLFLYLSAATCYQMTEIEPTWFAHESP